MKIIIASGICPEAIARLQREHDVVCAFNASEEELKRLIRDREVLIFRSGVRISAEVMACGAELRLLVRAGSGLDNLDVDYVKQRGLRLARIPGPGARAVAELSFALMLTLARQVLVGDSLLRQGRWAKHELSGRLLEGKVLGVVGAGNIGSVVGRLGCAWGMEVLGCVEHSGPSAVVRLREHGMRLTDLREILRRSDFVSIHVPLKDSTRNLIGVSELSEMKPGAFLLNLARGSVVDEQALYDALTRDGGLGGAALDVHQKEGEGQVSPLAGLANVVLTPHIGAMTIDTQRAVGRQAIEIIEDFAAEQPAALPTGAAFPNAIRNTA